ncbi:MAG: helix-turn-helix domain-containing protein [Candidatus Obscuribacterales bacterium]|nr:helix-turn-helix domain-containing protein [Candidatus Obscuribacterales bacterium]
MLTVKQVAAALGIDERSVREKLNQGTLKGTKKTIGQKDQWFVHQRDLDAELVRRGLSPINRTGESRSIEYTTTTAQSLNFSPRATGSLTEPPVAEPAPADVDDVDEIIAEVSEQPNTAPRPSEPADITWGNDLQQKMRETAETFMKPLIERVETLTRESFEKDRIIEEQKTQLLLLPDLESQRARLLQEIEAERKAAEIQFAKATEKEEQAKALEAENEKLRQKAEEAVLSATKLEQLEQEIQQLKQPKPSFWKRMFMPAGGQ